MQYGEKGWDAIQDMSSADRLARFQADSGMTFARNAGTGMAVGVASATMRGNFSSQVMAQVGLDVLGSTLGNAIADNAAARNVAQSQAGGLGGVAESYSERASAS